MKGDPWKVQDQYQASWIRDQQATQHSNSDKTQPHCHKGLRNTFIYQTTLNCNWILPQIQLELFPFPLQEETQEIIPVDLSQPCMS